MSFLQRWLAEPIPGEPVFHRSRLWYLWSIPRNYWLDLVVIPIRVCRYDFARSPRDWPRVFWAYWRRPLGGGWYEQTFWLRHGWAKAKWFREYTEQPVAMSTNHAIVPTASAGARKETPCDPTAPSQPNSSETHG